MIEVWKKLTSGRFILTVIAGIVFGVAVIMDKLNAEATASIISFQWCS